MLKTNRFKVCLLISAIVFYLSINNVPAEPCFGTDCPRSLSTTQGNAEYPEGWLLECDAENSAIEFPPGEPPVSVAVIGGVAPYKWEVNDGFNLDCTENCGSSNSISSQGTECIAIITVTDSTGRETLSPCKVRRPGYWQATFCYYEHRWGCYNNYCNSTEPTILDLGDHQVKFWCCAQSGVHNWTGACDDGWSYSAKSENCLKPGGCEDSGVNGLQIKKWICY